MSIKEACTLAGKSPRTIRYAISKGKLQSKLVKGARVIAYPSLAKLYSIEKPEENRGGATEDTVKTDNSDHAVVEQLLERVEDLKSQLAQKDKELERRAEELARKDKLLENEQIISRGLQDKIPQLMPPEEQRRGGIWSRLFGSK